MDGPRPMSPDRRHGGSAPIVDHGSTDQPTARTQAVVSDLARNPTRARPILPDEIEAYERDGVVCLRGVFDSSWLSLVGEAADEARRNPGPRARFWRVDASHAEFYEEARVVGRSEKLKKYVCDSPAAEVAATMMRSRTATFVYDQLFVKEPGIVKGTDWHQDAPYFPAVGEQLCVLWMPVERLSAEQTLEFVRGSHASGELYHFATPGHGRLDLPPMPDVYAAQGGYDVVTWAMEPGDVLVFHLRTFHGSRTRAGIEGRRTALSTRWAGDDIRFSTRGRLSVLDPEHGLREGESFAGPDFPQVWPRRD
jgi:hypothetical protein